MPIYTHNIHTYEHMYIYKKELFRIEFCAINIKVQEQVIIS